MFNNKLNKYHTEIFDMQDNSQVNEYEQLKQKEIDGEAKILAEDSSWNKYNDLAIHVQWVEG